MISSSSLRSRSGGAAAATSSRIAVDPSRLVLGGSALGDQEGALPISATVDQDEQATAFHIAAKSALPTLLRHPEPENIHRCPQIFEREHLASDRGPAVRGDNEVCPQFLTVGETHSCHPAPLLDEAGDGRFHPQVEPGEGFRFLSQEVEEIPLRHQRDERRRSVEMRKIADSPFTSGDSQLRAGHLVQRPL